MSFKKTSADLNADNAKICSKIASIMEIAKFCPTDLQNKVKKLDYPLSALKAELCRLNNNEKINYEVIDEARLHLNNLLSEVSNKVLQDVLPVVLVLKDELNSLISFILKTEYLLSVVV